MLADMRRTAFALGLLAGLSVPSAALATPKGSGPPPTEPPTKVPSLPPDKTRVAPPPIPALQLPEAHKGSKSGTSGKSGKKTTKTKELKTLPGTKAPKGIELKTTLIELDPLYEWRDIINRMPTPRKFDKKTGKLVRADKRLDMWGHRKRVSESLKGAGDDDKERARRMRGWAEDYEERVEDIKKNGRSEDKVFGVDTMEESAKKLRDAADRLDPPKPKPPPKAAGAK